MMQTLAHSYLKRQAVWKLDTCSAFSLSLLLSLSFSLSECKSIRNSLRELGLETDFSLIKRMTQRQWARIVKE